MSNRNPDIEYDQLPSVLDFYFTQRVKEINTAIPGIVQQYDPTTRRAVVLPALKTILTDGQEVSKAPLVNLPVLQPAAGGYIVHLPINPGDPVMLLFSQRGMDTFKLKFQESAPDNTEPFSLKDAVVLLGFGLGDVAVANTNELVLQTIDGGTHIRLGDGGVTIKATAVEIEGNLNVSGDIGVTGTVDTVDIAEHTHKFKAEKAGAGTEASTAKPT